MEFIMQISRPGKSWNLREGHGRSWKSNVPSGNEKKDKTFQKIIYDSATAFYLSRNRDKHAFYAL